MKPILTILLLSFSRLLFAQVANIPYPDIPLTGRNVHKFVPAHWVIKEVVSCDFNGDGLEDKALIIESKDTYDTHDTICFSSASFHPKMLLILFCDPNGGYHLSVKATKLFGTCESDGNVKITTAKNDLIISDEYWAYGNFASFTAAYRSGEWEIINASEHSNRNFIGKGSVDLITGRVDSCWHARNGEEICKLKMGAPKLIKLTELEEWQYVQGLQMLYFIRE